MDVCVHVYVCVYIHIKTKSQISELGSIVQHTNTHTHVPESRIYSAKRKVLCRHRHLAQQIKEAGFSYIRHTNYAGFQIRSRPVMAMHMSCYFGS